MIEILRSDTFQEGAHIELCKARRSNYVYNGILNASFKNQIIIIDRQEIYLRIKSSNVIFLGFSDSEQVGQPFDNSKEQYIFSIDKDKTIPFEKDELLNYYITEKATSNFSSDRYGSKNDRIGIGLLKKEKL